MYSKLKKKNRSWFLFVVSVCCTEVGFCLLSLSVVPKLVFVCCLCLLSLCVVSSLYECCLTAIASINTTIFTTSHTIAYLLARHAYDQVESPCMHQGPRVHVNRSCVPTNLQLRTCFNMPRVVISGPTMHTFTAHVPPMFARLCSYSLARACTKSTPHTSINVCSNQDDVTFNPPTSCTSRKRAQANIIQCPTHQPHAHLESAPKPTLCSAQPTKSLHTHM